QPRRAARNRGCRLRLTAVRRRHEADLWGGRFHPTILSDFAAGKGPSEGQIRLQGGRIAADRTNLWLGAPQKIGILPPTAKYIMTQTTEQNATEAKPKAGAAIVPVTPFEQNCTLIWCEATKKAVVVDPGGDVPRILAAIKQTGVSVEKIWLTHGHID